MHLHSDITLLSLAGLLHLGIARLRIPINSARQSDSMRPAIPDQFGQGSEGGAVAAVWVVGS
jgi:hypothetical protein